MPTFMFQLKLSLLLLFESGGMWSLVIKAGLFKARLSQPRINKDFDLSFVTFR